MKPETHQENGHAKVGEWMQKSDSTQCADRCDLQSLDLEKLLNEVMEGDQSALVAIYDRASTPLYSLALTMLQKEEYACDVIQETFAWIWVNSRTFKQHKGSAFSWLVGLVRQRALARVGRGWPRKSLKEYCDKIIPLVYPDRESKSTPWTSTIQEAFRNLSEEEQRVLKLAFFGGFTQHKIAQKVGASPESVRKYAFQGLRRLHHAIQHSMK